MNVIKLINELRTERQNIDEAISVLSRLSTGTPRRGRPPAYLGSAAPEGKKRTFSAATRRRMSIAQKKRRSLSS